MGVVDNIVIYGSVGAVVAYITNFMNFKVWADTNLFQQPPPPPPPLGPTGGFTEPQPVSEPAPFSAGKSGNCTWDTKGGWCWDSTACNGRCKTCTTVNTTDVSNGCGRARSHFISNASKCPACKSIPKPTPTPTNCIGPCPLGQTPKVINGKCGCAACTNSCPSPCYTRGLNCTCKINSGGLAYNDGTCQLSCNNRACFTNFPCGGSSKVKLCVNGSSCTVARNAWLAKYGCKTTTPKCETYLVNRCKSICSAHVGTTPYLDSKCSCFCRKSNLAKAYRSRSYKYQRNPVQEALDDGLMQVPTIA